MEYLGDIIRFDCYCNRNTINMSLEKYRRPSLRDKIEMMGEVNKVNKVKEVKEVKEVKKKPVKLGRKGRK